VAFQEDEYAVLSSFWVTGVTLTDVNLGGDGNVYYTVQGEVARLPGRRGVAIQMEYRFLSAGRSQVFQRRSSEGSFLAPANPYPPVKPETVRRLTSLATLADNSARRTRAVCSAARRDHAEHASAFTCSARCECGADHDAFSKLAHGFLEGIVVALGVGPGVLRSRRGR
jgi:hypothetical protein